MKYKWHAVGVISVILASILDVFSTFVCFTKFGTNLTIYEANRFIAPFINDPVLHFGFKLVLLLPVIGCALFAEKMGTALSNRYNYKAPHITALPYFIITIILLIASINNFILYFTELNLNIPQIIFGIAILIFASIYIILIRPYQIYLKNLGKKSIN